MGVEKILSVGLLSMRWWEGGPYAQCCQLWPLIKPHLVQTWACLSTKLLWPAGDLHSWQKLNRETERHSLSATYISVCRMKGNQRWNKAKAENQHLACIQMEGVRPLEWHAQSQGSDCEVKLHFSVQLSVCILRLRPSSRIFEEPTFLCSRLLFQKQWWLQCWHHHWMKT